MSVKSVGYIPEEVRYFFNHQPPYLYENVTSAVMNNNNNSIQFFIYLRADSTAIGLL
jgi:hypothetical protein